MMGEKSQVPSMFEPADLIKTEMASKANGAFSLSSHRDLGPMGRPPARKGEPTPRREAGN